MSELQPGFNVRSYGLFYSADRKQILFLEEKINGRLLVKFPGGGVEFQEGPGRALCREFNEELGLEVKLGPLVYVSPHFHRSVFRPQQLVGVYWEVLAVAGEPMVRSGQMKLHWLNWQEMPIEKLTHEMDREVLRFLRERCGRG